MSYLRGLSRRFQKWDLVDLAKAVRDELKTCLNPGRRRFLERTLETIKEAEG